MRQGRRAQWSLEVQCSNSVQEQAEELSLVAGEQPEDKAQLIQ